MTNSLQQNTLTVLLEEKPICSILIRKVESYFQDEENRRRFEEWYRKKYGKEYKQQQ